MKRAVKGILIASGIFFAAGLSLVLAGFLMGASWSQLGQTLTSGKYSFIGENHFIGFTGYDSSDFKGMDTSDAQEYKADEIENIIIEVGAGDLNIENNSSDMIQMENDSSRGKLGVRVEGGTMRIVLRGKQWSNGGEASINIPKDVKFENIQLDVAAGRINVDTLKAVQFDANVGAGKIECNGKIEADISSWNVEAGSILADLVKSRQIDLDCDAGKIEIVLEGDQDDFGLDGSCSAGKIEFGDNSYHSDVELYKSDLHAEQFVTASCDAGKIEIKFSK